MHQPGQLIIEYSKTPKGKKIKVASGASGASGAPGAPSAPLKLNLLAKPPQAW